jgi:ABC-type transport system involved in cytochrome bd biosynthesis fused ATPase/permease subunit
VETEHAIMKTLLQVTTGQSLLLLTHRHIFLDQMDQVYIIHNRQLMPYCLSIPAC